jgi:hypothetical protein
MPKEKPTKTSDGPQKLRRENVALRAENLKLQRRIVMLEAQMISANNKIVALRERIPASQLTDDELKDVIHQEVTGTH